jgi:hypothetical protein
MHVILGVTGITIGGEFDFGDILGHVTGVTIEAAVRSGQRKACLYVVIKAPPRPAIWVMAEPTVGPQAALVMAVRVARRAGQWRVLKAQRAVAFLASYDGMASNQGKSTDVMIERCHVSPVILAVTPLATRAQLAVVPVVLSVARYACRRQLVAIQIAGVACVALNLRVSRS